MHTSIDGSAVVIVAVAEVVVLVFLHTGDSARSTYGGELGVTVLAVLASPELTLVTAAGGVVVGGGGSVAFLFLVGA